MGTRAISAISLFCIDRSLTPVNSTYGFVFLDVFNTEIFHGYHTLQFVTLQTLQKIFMKREHAVLMKNMYPHHINPLLTSYRVIYCSILMNLLKNRFLDYVQLLHTETKCHCKLIFQESRNEKNEAIKQYP